MGEAYFQSVRSWTGNMYSKTEMVISFDDLCGTINKYFFLNYPDGYANKETLFGAGVMNAF